MKIRRRTATLLLTPILALGAACLFPPAAPAEELPLGLAPLSPNFGKAHIEHAALGQKLFFDKRLSRDGTISCATCHIPAQAFAQRGAATSEGIGGQHGRRNSPSLLNVAFARHLFLDGRSTSLEDQAWQPILAADEMGNHSSAEVLTRLGSIAEYRELFAAAFGIERPDEASVAKALAGYQRTLVSGNSPFDRWNWGGDDDALSAAAVEGYDLFAGQALCWQCHSLGGDDGVILTDHQFHDTGIGWLAEQRRKAEQAKGGDQPEPETKPDLGRLEVTGQERDRWHYKTPSLRNIALTPPYMHDGSIATLREVVEFYNRGGGDGATQELYLEPAEIDSLVAFLESLTGDQQFAQDPGS